MIIDILQVSKYHETYPLLPAVRNEKTGALRFTGWICLVGAVPHWFPNKGQAKKHMKSVTGKP